MSSVLEHHLKNLHLSLKIKFSELEKDLTLYQFTLSNKTKKKELVFSVSEGLNVDGEQFHSFRLLFKNLDPANSVRESFSIQDYCARIGNTELAQLHLINKADAELFDAVEKQLNFVAALLNRDEIQDLFLNDKWLEIKRDMRPYR